jgi:hypothetical protein
LKQRIALLMVMTKPLMKNKKENLGHWTSFPVKSKSEFNGY